MVISTPFIHGQLEEEAEEEVMSDVCCVLLIVAVQLGSGLLPEKKPELPAFCPYWPTAMLVYLLRVQPSRYADSPLLGVLKAVHVENVPAWKTVALWAKVVLKQPFCPAGNKPDPVQFQVLTLSASWHSTQREFCCFVVCAPAHAKNPRKMIG
jgi:hypothetical protein